MTRPAPRTGALRRIGRYAANAAMTVAIVACVAYIVPSFFGYHRYVITGGSMSGTFEKGAIAFEKEVPVADLRVGDVITYNPPPDTGISGLVTHRIVRIGTGEHGVPVFRTKGDANADPDPWTFSLTQPTQPVVDFTVPVAGHALIALADPDKRVLVIGVPAALIALASLVQLLRALPLPGQRGRRSGAVVA